MALYPLRHRFHKSHWRGFTLIELVVVTGIMVLISSLILTSSSKFGGVVTLRNLAYDIALSIRQAQTYGIAVRRFSNSNFKAGYGVHFDLSNSTSFVLFADAVSTNGLYDQGELVQSETIGRGFNIVDLCATTNLSDTEGCGLSSLDILFKRPEPDAQIRINGGAQVNAKGRIVVSSPRGDRLSIVVEAPGQIAVASAP